MAPPRRRPVPRGGDETTITGLAYGLSALIGAGIIGIGARFLLAPRAAAAGYGIPAGPEAGSAGPYLAVKGVRDVTSGLFVFILIAAQDPRVLGWLMLAATLIPIADSVIVLAHHGSKATAYGIHGATAALMLATSGLLLAAPP